MHWIAQDRLRLSERAQAKIRDLMKTHGSESRTVRLFAERAEDGSLELGLAFDERQDADYALASDGVTMVADPQTVALARDRVLDYGTEGFTFARDRVANPDQLPNSS